MSLELGFALSIEIWGYAVTGYEKIATRVCEQYPNAESFDGEMWDRTLLDIQHESINGQPVPLWWALRGARDPRWRHLYGQP